MLLLPLLMYIFLIGLVNHFLNHWLCTFYSPICTALAISKNIKWNCDGKIERCHWPVPTCPPSHAFWTKTVTMVSKFLSGRPQYQLITGLCYRSWHCFSRCCPSQISRWLPGTRLGLGHFPRRKPQRRGSNRKQWSAGSTLNPTRWWDSARKPQPWMDDRRDCSGTRTVALAGVS